MNNLKNNVKYFAKLSGFFALKFLMYYIIGIILTIIFLIVGLYLLTQTVGNTGHSGAHLFIIATISAKPITGTLFYLTFILSPYLLFTLSIKIAISYVINKILNDRSEDLIISIIDKLFDKFRKIQPKVLQNSADYTLVKLKMIQDIKRSNENKIIKRILMFGLKKITFDDIDFTSENLSFYDILKRKLIEKLHELSEPSTKLFWIFIGFQVILLLLMYLIKY